MTSIVRRYLEPLPLMALIVLAAAGVIACLILGWRVTGALCSCVMSFAILARTLHLRRQGSRPRSRTATGEIVIRDLAGPDEPAR